MNFDTSAIHSGLAQGQFAGASTVPIFQSAAHSYKSAQELADVFAGAAPGHIYARITNPTNFALEKRLADLEDGIGAIAAASGMAAISSVVLGLVRAGDEIITTNGIFGGTVSLFANTLSRFGIVTKFIDPRDADNFKNAITAKTKLIFVESLSNPALFIPDISEIAKTAKSANIPLVVDNTAATPYIFMPGDFGASIVVHSTSKFINGHGTAIGGAIIDTGNYDWLNGIFDDIRDKAGKAGNFAFLSHLRNLICRDLGGCASPFTSFLMLQGLETLGIRMEKHCDNARKLADFLNQCDDVAMVNYPGLAGNASFETANRLFGGRYGSLLTFGLGSREKAFKFIDSLTLAKNLANIGDAKTVVIHPASTIFHEFSDEKRIELGIADDMIRVSVGIENYDDIKEDFKNAIEKTLRR